MGCFLACFGSSKEEKRRYQRKHKIKALLRDQRYGSPNSLQHHTLSTEKVTSAEPLNLKTDLPNGVEEELSLTTAKKVTFDADLPDVVEEELSLTTRKKVTFDTNVKTYEPVSVHESTEVFSEAEKKSENQRDNSEKSSLLSDSHSEDDSITSSVGSYPPNHRYQNCRDSDDEIEEYEYGDSDLDDENDDRGEYSDCDEDECEILGQRVWTESVPTASMESSTEISSVLAAAEEVDGPLVVSTLAEKEGFNRNVQDRSINVHPVLNPVENIAQWKAAKSKPTTQLKPQKENFTANQEESRLSCSFMSKSDQSENQNQEISVDASLSNWLTSSKSIPVKKTSPVENEPVRSYSQGSNSVISIEDRPILGALTVKEIKQFSASNSPRRSPTRSPDEMAIIGTVGRYWNSSDSAKDSNSVSSYKGIPNSTSKYKEDKKVVWHSTPFETRLERALKGGENDA